MGNVGFIDFIHETGKHPLLPWEHTPLHGIWRWQSGALEARGMLFADGISPPESFFIPIINVRLTFENRHTLVGYAGAREIPCPDGPEGCLNPTEMEFPEPTDSFVSMTRLRFDD